LSRTGAFYRKPGKGTNGSRKKLGHPPNTETAAEGFRARVFPSAAVGGTSFWLTPGSFRQGKRTDVQSHRAAVEAIRRSRQKQGDLNGSEEPRPGLNQRKNVWRPVALLTDAQRTCRTHDAEIQCSHSGWASG